MSDELYSGMLLYRNVKVSRAIPQYLIARPKPRYSDQARNDGVLFLNEPIYEHYQSFDRYKEDLVSIIGVLVRQFSKVYFKFHPRESQHVRNLIGAALANFERIEYYPFENPIEFSIGRLPVGFACSYISTALLNLCQRDIEPIFIYVLLPDLKDKPIFVRATEALEQVGYRFPSDWTTVSPSFKSGLCGQSSSIGAKALADFVVGK
jgi:hypothetical protein